MPKARKKMFSDGNFSTLSYVVDLGLFISLFMYLCVSQKWQDRDEVMT